MVCVKVGHKDALDPESGPEAHHLALSALSAVEKKQIPFPLHTNTADVPAHCRAGSSGAEESYADHE